MKIQITSKHSQQLILHNKMSNERFFPHAKLIYLWGEFHADPLSRVQIPRDICTRFGYYYFVLYEGQLDTK